MSASRSSSNSNSGGGAGGEEGEEGGVHVARSLFEEGVAVFCGYDFKQIDETRGRAMIEAASAAGCPSAEAYCHCEGWGGFAVDLKMAFAMFQEIAKKTGFACAENMVGYCFGKGKGVEQNFTKAVEWYTKAAEKGLSAAMMKLGYCFYEGEGVEQNLAKALEWYTKAQDAGVEDAGAWVNDILERLQNNAFEH